MGFRKKIDKIEKTIQKKEVELQEAKDVLKAEKEKNKDSLIAKLKQAGDVVIETRKMMDDVKKSTKILVGAGAVALGLSIAANIATIATCAELTGKKIDIKKIMKGGTKNAK